MIVSIHQPDYIPYLGYFYKIYKSDKFVFLDDVQYSKNNFHNRNSIKTPQGQFFLTIPVGAKLGQLINEIDLPKNIKWKKKHLKTIEMNYKKAPFFKEVFEDFEKLLMKEYNNLAEMNMEINIFISKKLGFKTTFLKSSSMNITTKKEQRVIDICSDLKADEYFSGLGAKNYEEESHFLDKKIKLTYTDFEAKEYPQLWNGFIPNMSILDYLFNVGYNWRF